jgi:hypothetical protein
MDMHFIKENPRAFTPVSLLARRTETGAFSQDARPRRAFIHRRRAGAQIRQEAGGAPCRFRMPGRGISL